MSIVQSNNFSLSRRILRWYQKQLAIREMRSLPDYLLADIGVRRDEIPALVNGMLSSQVSWLDAPKRQQKHPFETKQQSTV